MHGIVELAVNILRLLHVVFLVLPSSRGTDVSRGEATLSSSPPEGIFYDENPFWSYLDRAIAAGRLSEARRIALGLLVADPDREGEIARSFAEGCDERFASDAADGDDDGGHTYLAKVADALVGGGGDRQGRPAARVDWEGCWDGGSGDDDAPGSWGSSEAWDRCCSRLPQTTKRERRSGGIWERGMNEIVASSAGPDHDEAGCFDVDGTTPLCCEYFAGSRNHLRLPALRELSLRLRLDSDDDADDHKEATRVIEIEQDGFLRRFEPSGILWPAGYLLALCVAAPVKCGMPELLLATAGLSPRHATRPVAIELGAGVGASTIALARGLANLRGVDGGDNVSSSSTSSTGPLVVATDASPGALALVLANSHANGVRHLVAVSRTNHTDYASLATLKRRFFPASGKGDGFDVVIGSSLQSLFVGTEHPDATLWHVLDSLLSRTNPNAVAVLAHTRSERILAPSPSPWLPDDDHDHDRPNRTEKPTRFMCVRRVSGDDFGMFTRDGSTSDFEVSLFMRERSAATSHGLVMKKDRARDESGEDVANEL